MSPNRLNFEKHTTTTAIDEWEGGGGSGMMGACDK